MNETTMTSTAAFANFKDRLMYSLPAEPISFPIDRWRLLFPPSEVLSSKGYGAIHFREV